MAEFNQIGEERILSLTEQEFNNLYELLSVHSLDSDYDTFSIMLSMQKEETEEEALYHVFNRPDVSIVHSVIQDLVLLKKRS